MLNIKEWAEEDRPREKFVARGAEALTDAELLAILVGSGNSEENAVDLMRRVLADCSGSLRTLGQKRISDLVKTYKGMGPVKAITILAACELGRRRLREEAVVRKVIRTGADVSAYFSAMHELGHEECRVLMLNQAHGIIGDELISKGGLASASVDVRVIFRSALLHGAASIVLCHNHPSGNLRPSADDDKLTRGVQRAGETMNIRLIDHVIVSECGYYSYLENDKL